MNQTLEDFFTLHLNTMFSVGDYFFPFFHKKSRRPFFSPISRPGGEFFLEFKNFIFSVNFPSKLTKVETIEKNGLKKVFSFKRIEDRE